MTKQYNETLYKQLAASRNLIFVGPLPSRTTEKTKWRCIDCGTVIEKTFRSVYNNKDRGHRCNAPNVLSEAAYLRAARDLGVTWTPGEYKPSSTKKKTFWRTPEGELIEASYYEMVYKMPNRIKRILGLPYRDRGGAVNAR